MAPFIEPSKGRVRSFWVQTPNSGQNPTNLVQYVHCIRTYESVCKSYITAQVIIYDNNNLIENMGIQPGDPAGFAFESPPNTYLYGTTFDGGQCGNLQVVKMKGEEVPGTLKYQIYYLDLIGPTFYLDKRQQISRAYPGTTGTDIVSEIWKDFLTSPTYNILVQSPSDGLMGKDLASYVRIGESPLTAIKAVMNEMIGRHRDTGSWMIYKNRDGVVLKQLEDMLAGISGQGSGNLQQIKTALDANGQQE